MGKASGLFAFVALLAVGPLTAHACMSNAECDDGNVCNGSEFCQAGVCFPAAPLACDDQDACTLNNCDPVLGCQFPAAGGCMMGGRSFTLSNYGTLRIRMSTLGGYGGGAFPEPFGPNDPVLHGASLRVYTTSGDVFDNTYGMPSSNWAYIGPPESRRGYVYRDFIGAFGPIRHALVHNGKASNLHGSGPALNFSIHTDPRPVNVIWRFGDLLDCLSYGIGRVHFNPEKIYGVRGAPPPATCP